MMDWRTELSSADREALLAWFAARARDLPWRRERTPYRVWISEIMLQQTRVETALPYYECFLAALPDLAALADADEDLLMALWAGLGYYSRARNLRRCAREIVERHGGVFPADPAELAALPGLGPYTVAAVGSLAFGLDLAAVDGNVIRVLARLFALDEDLRRPAAARRLREAAQALLPSGRAGEWNEALMELGATLCRPRNPLCEACPLAGACRARAEGRTAELPRRAARAERPERAVSLLVVRDEAGRLLARRRGDDGMLRGLWELPSLETGSDPTSGDGEQRRLLEAEHLARLAAEAGRAVEALGRGEGFRHEYSHYRAQVWPLHCRTTGADRVAEAGGGWRWLEPGEERRLGFSSRDRRLLDEEPERDRARSEPGRKGRSR